MISVQYNIYGKVQGVAYRAFVSESAQKLGIVGWVKNQKDGSVECLAYADERNLETFEACLNNGPRWARVARVEKKEWTETLEFEKFEVIF